LNAETKLNLKRAIGFACPLPVISSTFQFKVQRFGFKIWTSHIER